mmetsp:Transcript_28784/g.60272  ORF Transcript_28784/g.60272 Transcript_28784/m.60272 type:complete len:92 (+) Transcript_28784:2542-2817(+)
MVLLVQFKQTALIWAASMGHVESVKVLVREKANIEQSDKHLMTPLHWAAYHSREEALRTLLEAKADTNAKSKSGCTPLAMASDPRCKAALR